MNTPSLLLPKTVPSEGHQRRKLKLSTSPHWAHFPLLTSSAVNHLIALWEAGQKEKNFIVLIRSRPVTFGYLFSINLTPLQGSGLLTTFLPWSLMQDGLPSVKLRDLEIIDQQMEKNPETSENHHHIWSQKSCLQCVYSVFRGQKRWLDPVEVELNMAVSYHMCSWNKIRLVCMAANAANHCSIFSTPPLTFIELACWKFSTSVTDILIFINQS